MVKGSKSIEYELSSVKHFIERKIVIKEGTTKTLFQ